MGRRLARLVPSVQALVLAAAALVTVTLATAASVVSLGPGGRIAVESEPVVAWIAVAGVVVIFAVMPTVLAGQLHGWRISSAPGAVAQLLLPAQ